MLARLRSQLSLHQRRLVGQSSRSKLPKSKPPAPEPQAEPSASTEDEAPKDFRSPWLFKAVGVGNFVIIPGPLPTLPRHLSHPSSLLAQLWVSTELFTGIGIGATTAVNMLCNPYVFEASCVPATHLCLCLGPTVARKTKKRFLQALPPRTRARNARPGRPATPRCRIRRCIRAVHRWSQRILQALLQGEKR